MRNGLSVLVMIVLCGLSAYGLTVAAAEEPVEEEKSEEQAEGDEPGILSRPIYVAIKPAFIVNYGGVGKLKYLKLEISLRVADISASNAARHHMPLLRDHLVTLFSRQTDEDIDTRDAKEQLRLAALAGVQKVLMDEDGEQGVTNLFFSHFIVQR
jgi:flagellar FliL protein